MVVFLFCILVDMPMERGVATLLYDILLIAENQLTKANKGNKQQSRIDWSAKDFIL